jgi:RNA polymerase sigma factor (sigma-70 family)
MDFTGPSVSDKSAAVSKEEGEELFRKWKESGCQASRERLILSVLWYALFKAQQHSRPGYCLEDALQDAMVGVLKAFEKFQPEKAKFVTYAHWWILSEIDSAKSRWDKRTLPQYLESQIAELLDNLGGKYGVFEDVIAAIEECDGVTASAAVMSKALTGLIQEQPPNCPYSDWLDAFADPHAQSPADEVEQREDLKQLTIHIGLLPEPHKSILLMMMDGVPISKIAEKYEITRNKIAVYEQEALDILSLKLQGKPAARAFSNGKSYD